MRDAPVQPKTASPPPSTWALLVAMAALYALFVGAVVDAMGGFALDLGSLNPPTEGVLLLLACSTVFGLPLVALTWSVLGRLGVLTHDDELRSQWRELAARDGVRVVMACAVLVPLVLRQLVLQGAPVTDDEAAYLFEAQLIASGRLWVPSPTMPVFFDNVFIVNDGKMYGQYFLGWPALLASGVLVKAPWLVNPLLSGCTAWFVTEVARARWGKGFGLLAGFLYVSSPFVHVSAATLMSHSSEMWALAGLTYAATAAPLTARRSLAVALFFCTAFSIRPATAVGVGTPMLVVWLGHVRRAPSRWQHLLLWAGVSGLMAALFLGANQALTGSPWRTGYHAGFQHAIDTQFRFVPFGPQDGNADDFFYFFVGKGLAAQAAKYAYAALRLWVDAYGVPTGIAFALLARRDARVFAWQIAGLVVTHAPLPDVGIDSFGPVHFTELMLPLTWLGTSALRWLWEKASARGQAAPFARFLCANALVGLASYGPIRLTTLGLLAEDVRAPLDAFASAPPHSVVFYRRHFTPYCASRPGRGWVFFRPNNDPDLASERLWANHISLTRDKQLVASMPGRNGYLLKRDPETCVYGLVPLVEATEQDFPPATSELPGDFDVRLRRK
jgi:hypothetical protein